MCRHKHNARGSIGESLLHLAVERRAVHDRHTKITQNQIVGVHG
jgi:hypothetical protein